MKRDQKFLSKLENELVKNKIKNKDEVLSNYKNIIDNRKLNKEKISDILKDFDTPEKIVLNEKEKQDSVSFKNKFKNYFVNALNKLKSSVSKFKNNLKKTDKEKDDQNNKEKIKDKKIKDRKFKFKKIKNKKNINIEVSEVIEEKTKETIDNNQNNNEKTVNEEIVIEENKEIKETKTEEKPYEQVNKKVKINNIVKLCILILFLIILSVIFVLFISSCFAILDGVKVYGIVISLFGILLLLGWICLIVYFKIINHKLKRLFSITIVIVSIFMVSFGVALSIRSYFKLERIYDVSEKYSMNTKIDTFNLPMGNKKFYINFNSNYKTKYIIEYDNKLESSIKVETKYYEAYYNYFVKKNGNNIYISLKENSRDRLSVYISDLKENKIFDNKEFARYTVRIIMNESDKEKVVVN